jgi:hypothetical protein
MDIKLRYLSLYVGAILKFKENTRYSIEGTDDSANLMFQERNNYQVTFWTLTILADEANASALENAYVVLRTNKGLAALSLKEFDSKSRHDAARIKLMHSGTYFNADPLTKGWAKIDDSAYVVKNLEDEKK